VIALADTSPTVAVDPAEYTRLLGYPPGRTLSGRACELATMAAVWYAQNGRPWIWAREAAKLEIAGDVVRIEGAAFTSARLRSALERAGAHTVVLAAASAGPELEAHSARLWREEKPDEYFFFEMYGSAVVEQLITMAGARLCLSAERSGMAVLPHYSPGYAEWDVAELPGLLRLMDGLPYPIEALETGATIPKKSQLAVFGLTRDVGHLTVHAGLVPCENCSFGPCDFRRAPYRRAPAAYTVNPKALRRWAAERVTLEPRADGGIDARFRFDGTTCTNMGRPLAFEYYVRLSPAAQGYRICEQRCAPSANDTGHTSMCEYIRDAEALMGSIGSEAPLAGRPLGDVLAWPRPALAAGCYCEAESRDHKWGLVLETIHYALHQGKR
jgi:hypothetical protein